MSADFQRKWVRGHRMSFASGSCYTYLYGMLYLDAAIPYQQRVSPCVYLDHWALNTIARDISVAASFRKILLARNGTVAVSAGNVIEFRKVTDFKQIQAAESFLESLRPHLFFQTADWNQVVKAERTKTTTKNGADSEDPVFETYVAKAKAGDGESMHAFLEWISLEPFRAQYLVMARSLEKKAIRDFKALFAANKKAKGRLLGDQSLKNALSESKTWGFVWAMLGYLYTRRSQPFRPNDVHDLFHTIVPVSQCQYVLADGNVVHNVASVRTRLLGIGSDIKLAKVYSRRNEGVPAFFDDFERD